MQLGAKLMTAREVALMTSMASTSHDENVEISVVVPVYLGLEWLPKCLESLAAQTFTKSDFEVILVFNGPPDGGQDLSREFGRTHPEIRLRLIECDTPSASSARNLGTAVAKGKYLTWLDCDDWVSPEYLELLYLSAAKGVVPMAQIIDVDDQGIFDENSLINRSILEHTETYVSPKDFPRGLSFMVCKLLPTWMARAVKFDESLRSGEDVALYGAMYARFGFTFSMNPAYAGAKYYRLRRDGSVSRQSYSFDFWVQQRIDVISSLNLSLQKCRPEARPLLTSFINSQASFIRKYFREHPNDQHEIIKRVSEASFSYFPWGNWYEGASSLVVAYNFLPYGDTGAMVTAKRIREAKEPVDVITHEMDNVRHADSANDILAQPFVQLVGRVKGPAYFASYEAISKFVVEGMRIVDGWKRSKGRSYSEIYSRAMWPASHFLAALYKVRNPDVYWRAEFSDPVQLTTTGIFRSQEFVPDCIAFEILDFLDPSMRTVLRENLNVFFWTEYLAYFLADELVFTNRNQLDTMVSYAENIAKKSIADKAKVHEQPTLEPYFYNIRRVSYPLRPGVMNLAYFGEFYSTRGLDEVLEALRRLSGSDRQVLHLHVFTSKVEEAKNRIALLGLGDVITVNRPLPFFEFLNATLKFDVLVVNDATTANHHPINPYLPSKLSDYRGSGSNVWAVYEEGSALSSFETAYRSPIGNVAAATEVLQTLLREG